MARGKNNTMVSIGVKIEDGKDGLKTLTTSAESLRKVLASTVTESEKLNKSYINFAAFANSFNQINSAFSEIGGVLQSLSGDSLQFAAAMKATNTMAGKDAAGFGELKDQVTDLAKSIPLAREELANGLYQVISNGVPEDNWIEFLNASSRSAVGGIADLGTAVTVTSTIIKNYGLEWDKAREIQDKIQLTAKNGVTSFEQLAGSLPKVTGNAATLGVGIDELMASFATLTGVSGNTAEVATQLAAIFTALVKPSSEAGKMAAQMGIQFDAAAIKAAGGFQNFIKQLNTDVQSFAQSSGMLEQEIYGKLFGSAESLRALIPLTGELADKFDQNVLSMKDSAGTMDAAFEEMASTGASKSQLLKNKWAEVSDFIARTTSGLLPYLDFGSSVLTSATSIYTLSKAVQQLNYSAKISKVANAALAISVKALGIKSGSAATLIRVLKGSMDGGIKSAIALKVAIRGLLITTGVGLAFFALSAAMEAFSGAADKASSAESELNNIRKTAAERVGEETTKLRLLTDAARNEKLSLDERKSAIVQLNSIIPEYNAELDETTGKYKENKKALDDYISSLTRKYEIEGAEDTLRALGKERAVLAVERGEIQKSINAEQSARANQTMSGRPATSGGASMPGVALGQIGAAGRIKALRNELDNVDKQLDQIKEKEETIFGIYGTDLQKKASTPSAPEIVITPKQPNLSSPAGGKKRGNKTSKEMSPEGSIGYYEDQISNIDKKVKFAIDPDEIYKLETEKAALQKKIKDIELPIRIVSTKEYWDKMIGKIDPIKLDVEVDEKSLSKGIQDIPKALTPAEKLQETLGNISGVASQAGEAFRNMGQAFEMPALDVMGILAGAIATMIQGFATASAQSTAMGPIGWLGFGLTGLAQLTAMISQVKNLSAFAEGGIVSGPTLGLVGEYAGAKSNPEVIAPLNKLKEIIGEPASAPVIVGGRIVADGRNLAVVLENYTRVSGKSGHRNKF